MSNDIFRGSIVDFGWWYKQPPPVTAVTLKAVTDGIF
jgi:hypothetical protein